MGDTSISTSHAITAEQFNDMAFRQYVDKLVLKPYMGMSTESVVQVKEDLAKQKGDALTFNLAYSLSGAGVTSGSTMEGSEEAMTFYGHRIVLEEYRNAVRDAGTMSRQRTPFELNAEFGPALTTWLAQKSETALFASLASINNVAYASASESDKDAWLVANADRMLFGAAVVNAVSGDHSTSLLTVDSTTDILNCAQISLAKRLAQLASPKIRPIKIENGEEYYVMFVHPLCARDLKNSSDWLANQRGAAPRSNDNPVFTGMIGIHDGVIIKESPKVSLLSAVGGSSINVAVNSLCGAQALLYAQGGYPENGNSRVVLTEKKFDYDTQVGMQIKSMWANAKAVFNSKQHGVVTVYSAAVAD
jgi:N4-gp56 family major capsid protein